MRSCRSSAARAAPLLAVLLAGCRLHYDSIRDGGGWTPADYAGIVVGKDGRAEVLERMGPPDDLSYTLTDEVFLYRIGAHRGSELRLLVPDSLINFTRPGFERAQPALDVPEEFQGQPPPLRFLEFLTGFVVGFFNPVSAQEALGLFGRRLRWDVVRVVLDRDTHVVLAKQFHRGTRASDAKELMKEALLQDENGGSD